MQKIILSLDDKYQQLSHAISWRTFSKKYRAFNISSKKQKNQPTIDHAKHFVHSAIKLFYCQKKFVAKGFYMRSQYLPVYKGSIKTKIKGFMILAARMKLWNGHVQWPICCNICRENFLETTYIYVGLYYALVFNTVYFSTSTVKMP